MPAENIIFIATAQPHIFLKTSWSHRVLQFPFTTEPISHKQKTYTNWPQKKYSANSGSTPKYLWSHKADRLCGYQSNLSIDCSYFVRILFKCWEVFAWNITSIFIMPIKIRPTKLANRKSRKTKIEFARNHCFYFVSKTNMWILYIHHPSW